MLLLVLLSLASWRITRLVTTDLLPLGAIRTRLEADMPTATITYAMHCSWCVGLWVACALTAAYDVAVGTATPWLYALAAAAMTGLLSQVEGIIWAVDQSVTERLTEAE
jgi:HAMP domain-containing protein